MAIEQTKEPTNEEKIKELTEVIENLQFLSDPVRFNSVLYSGLKQIILRLDAIGGILDKLKENPTINQDGSKE